MYTQWNCDRHGGFETAILTKLPLITFFVYVTFLLNNTELMSINQVCLWNRKFKSMSLKIVFKKKTNTALMMDSIKLYEMLHR